MGRGRPGCLCPASWQGGRAGLGAQGPVGNTGECPRSPAVRTAGPEVSPGRGKARPQEDGGLKQLLERGAGLAVLELTGPGRDLVI